MLAQRLAAGIHDDQGLARASGLLEEGRGNRMVLGRVGAGHDDHVGIRAGGEGGGHRPRTDALEERHHRRSVAQARAVVDVVGAEAGADQLLHQVCLFVGALGGAESGHRPRPVPIPHPAKSRRGEVERLLPGCLPEVGPGVRGIDLALGVLGGILPANQGPGQAMGMAHVVEAESALDAEALLVGGTVAALHRDDAFVVELVGDLATDSAVGADARHLPQGLAAAHSVLVHQRRFHQRPVGRPGRTPRTRRRCSRPSGRRNRTRSSSRGRGRRARSRR